MPELSQLTVDRSLPVNTRVAASLAWSDEYSRRDGGTSKLGLRSQHGTASIQRRGSGGGSARGIQPSHVRERNHSLETDADICG